MTYSRNNDYVEDEGRIGDDGEDLLDPEDEDYQGNGDDCTAAGCNGGGGGGGGGDGHGGGGGGGGSDGCNDYSGVDAGGDDCSWYSANPLGCGGYDTTSFSSYASCCACGGGWYPEPEPSPEPEPEPFEYGDCTDMSGVDRDGDSCGAYARNPGWCNNYDTDSFTSSIACCACGGGTYPGDEDKGGDDEEEEIIDDNEEGEEDEEEIIDGGDNEEEYEEDEEDTECVDDPNYFDAFGDSCSWYSSNILGCGLSEASYIRSSNEACCACGGGVYGSWPEDDDCVDSLTAKDEYGSTCAWYSVYPDSCGAYDDYRFKADEACCYSCTRLP